jgi:pyruvate kinase
LTLGIEALIASTRAAAVVTPTRGGAAPRNIARLRLPVWILAPTVQPQTLHALAFSYGVQPVHVPATVIDWSRFTREQVEALRLSGDVALLVQGPFPQRPDANHSIELVSCAPDRAPGAEDTKANRR